MSSGAKPEPSPPEAPLPGLGYDDRADESDEHPAAQAFVRAKARVAPTARPKGPSFEKVAGRSPGAPPPDESARNPRMVSPRSLPEAGATPTQPTEPDAPRSPRDVLVRPVENAVGNAIVSTQAAYRGHRPLIVSVVVVLLILGVSALIVLRRNSASATPPVAPSGG